MLFQHLLQTHDVITEAHRIDKVLTVIPNSSMQKLDNANRAWLGDTPKFMPQIAASERAETSGTGAASASRFIIGDGQEFVGQKPAQVVNHSIVWKHRALHIGIGGFTALLDQRQNIARAIASS